MRARRDADLLDELRWLVSSIEAAQDLAQMAEGDSANATRLATRVHAVLRLASARLLDIARDLEDPQGDWKAKRR